MTKPFTVRLKVVVSSAPKAARFKNPRTVSGALFGNMSITIRPCSVSRVTHWPVICATDALTNGSVFGVGDATGRALAFFKVSALGAGFWAKTTGDDAARI